MKNKIKIKIKRMNNGLRGKKSINHNVETNIG
jgi:hypothetical protein